jgi:Astacin (Peptidase family M12A)
MNLKKLLAIAIFYCMSLAGYTIMAQSGTSTLTAGSRLTEGQRLVSTNQVYYLGMQTDGNLCIKKVQDDGFVWCSMVNLGSGCQLILQADGNLVVSDKNNKAVWFSMTQAYFDPKFGTADWKPVRAVIEDNGTLCLYSATNKKVWTNTDKKAAPIVDPGVGFTGPTIKKNLSIRLPMASAPANYNVEINNRGEVFYNGDMNLGTLESLAQNAQAPQDVNAYKWPNSTIPYVLPNNHLRRDMIQKGIEYLNANTTLCLVPKTKNHTDYVEFIARNGNWSMIGRVGGRQEISVENNNIGTVIHEIMHALGFHHTQCREDRDKYVTINMSNVEKGMEHNFEKCTDKQSNLGVYDYTSCMHYPSYGFAVNKSVKTIIRKDGKGEEMGDWDGMSATDITNIAVVYPQCPGKPPVNPTTNPTTATCDAKDAVKKYQTSMKPGERFSEKEKMMSANGRFQFRATTDGNFVIEEILNSGNCSYKEVYRFPLVNGGSKPAVSFFSYNPDGNICMDNKLGKTYCVTDGQDAMAAVILTKSIKLELTDDGRLRLINDKGEEIWATSPGPKTNPITKPTTDPTPTADCGVIKYQISMKPGDALSENEILVSANGRYQFRYNGEKSNFAIEEVINRSNCQFKQVYSFQGLIPMRGRQNTSPFVVNFYYVIDGDVIITTPNWSGKFSTSTNTKDRVNPHRDNPRVDVRNKSTRLELTDEGRIRLINNSGQVIWTTTDHDK